MIDRSATLCLIVDLWSAENIPYIFYLPEALSSLRAVCCGNATFLGGSGYRSPRSRSRLRLRPSCVYKLIKFIINTRTRIFVFAFLKDQAGAAIKKGGSDRPKNRLRSRPKIGGSGSATLSDSKVAIYRMAGKSTFEVSKSRVPSAILFSDNVIMWS